MRFETATTTMFYFTVEEVEYMQEHGIWDLLCSRLRDNEGFKIEQG